MGELASTFLTILVTATTTFLGVLANRWLKRTPEAVSPEQYTLDTLKELRQQFREEREARIASEARMEARVKELEREVRIYLRDQGELKRFIIVLENYIEDAGISLPERPESVVRIFNE